MELAHHRAGAGDPLVLVHGTGSQWQAFRPVLEALEARREVIGDFELNASFRFGGIPFPVAEQSMRLFAKEVLPVIQSWQTAHAPAVVERAAAE